MEVGLRLVEKVELGEDKGGVRVMIWIEAKREKVPY
jgi:hypothetical protein